MSVFDPETYVVRRALHGAQPRAERGSSSPPLVYLSAAQIPQASAHAELAWVTTPGPSSTLAEWVLDHDQFVLCIGMDQARPQVLGATVELALGGQPIVFNTTTLVFIPKGTPYRPPVCRESRGPYLRLWMTLGTGDPHAIHAPLPAGGVGTGRRGAGSSTTIGADIDYEQYVVRSPMREAGPSHVEGRQNPTMTYLSRVQLPVQNDYLEFGWIWAPPQPPIPKMRHDDYDEIVWHLGSDPSDPEDLGAVLQFGIGDALLEFDTTHCAFIPGGLDHGPLIWKEVQRPMIEIVLMVGAGTLEEGWANSFFDLPNGSRRGPK